jgi:hypothetical protein
MMLLLAVSLETIYRFLDIGADFDLPTYISLVNWVFLLVYIVMSILHSRMLWMQSIVCPSLTLMLFLYLSFVDYDYTMGSIYYSLITGFTLSFFILIIFNESWLLSSIVFIPCLVFYMQKTGKDLLGSEPQELIMRCIFISLIYTIVAYKIEVLTKQSFLGRESSEKAFHRWMKIFETFPEGIALIRNDYILYSNRALKHILNCGTERSVEDDPLYELLKNDLKISCVQ